MIHTLGAEKFDLDPKELCFGFYDHLELNCSDRAEIPTTIDGTADIVFQRDAEQVDCIRLWVPIK